MPRPWPSWKPEVVQDWIAAVLEHPFVRKHVRHQARRLSRHRGFSPQDRVDVLQELHVALVKALPNYRRRSHLFYFVQLVVHNTVLNLQRERVAKKRQCGRVVPLRPEEGLAEVAMDQAAALDVQEALSRSPVSAQRLAEFLMAGHPVQDAIYRLKTTKADVQHCLGVLSRVLKRLHRWF